MENEIPHYNPYSVEIDIGGVWRYSLFFGLLACLLLIAFRSWRGRLGWEAAALWAWCVASAIYIIEWPQTNYAPYQRAYESSAGWALGEMLLVPLAILALRASEIDRLLAWGKWIALGKIILVWSEPWHSYLWASYSPIMPWLAVPGSIIAPSFETALLALYVPFAAPWLAVLAVATILFHHGTTAYVILIAEAFAFCLSRRWAWKYLLLAIPALLALSIEHSNGYLLDGQWRIAMYERYLQFWQQQWSWRIFGIGAGGFMWTSFAIDKFNPKDLYLAMHSDWLQALFEYGAIGLALLALVFLKALRRSWRDIQMRAAILGAGAFCLFYYPLHTFPGMALFGLIFGKALFGRIHIGKI